MNFFFNFDKKKHTRRKIILIQEKDNVLKNIKENIPFENYLLWSNDCIPCILYITYFTCAFGKILTIIFFNEVI